MSESYETGWQYSVSGTNIEPGNGASLTPGTTTVNGWSARRKQQAKLEHHQPWWSVSVCRNLFRSRLVERNHNSARHRNNSNYRHYFYLLAIVLAAPANAETIGGVSATAAPTATSSGSVTNQAVMIAPSQHLTNSYGNGIQCQGPILTVTPYVNPIQILAASV